jgi:hypothetical protein
MVAEVAKVLVQHQTVGIWSERGFCTQLSKGTTARRERGGSKGRRSDEEEGEGRSVNPYATQKSTWLRAVVGCTVQVLDGRDVFLGSRKGGRR